MHCSETVLNGETETWQWQNVLIIGGNLSEYTAGQKGSHNILQSETCSSATLKLIFMFTVALYKFHLITTKLDYCWWDETNGNAMQDVSVVEGQSRLTKIHMDLVIISAWLVKCCCISWVSCQRFSPWLLSGIHICLLFIMVGSRSVFPCFRSRDVTFSQRILLGVGYRVFSTVIFSPAFKSHHG